MWCTLSTNFVPLFKPRAHADIIHAWADGAKVEYYYEADKAWYDAGPYPFFREKDQLRLRSNMLAMMHDVEHNTPYIAMSQSVEDTAFIEQSPDFVYWM